MKNEALAKLEGLVGSWKLTLTDAWFLESRDVRINASAEIDWLDDAFLRFRWVMEDEDRSWSDFIIGRSDAREEYKVLTNDYRGVARLFEMTFDGRTWTMWRADPDFHQGSSRRLSGTESSCSPRHPRMRARPGGRTSTSSSSACSGSRIHTGRRAHRGPLSEAPARHSADIALLP